MSELPRVPRGLPLGPSNWLELVRRAINSTRTPVYVRATVNSVALPDATWTALTISGAEAQGALATTSTMRLPSGLYMVDFSGVYGGSASVELGYTTDATNYTSIADDIPPPTLAPILLESTGLLRLGLRASGAGNLASGDFTIMRVSL